MSDTLPLSILNNRRMDKWLRFQPDRTVKLAVGKVEIGQGVLIALSQIAAEELDVAIDRIDILSGDTADAPDEGSTSSSQSIEVSGRSVRLVSAELRARVLDRLAQRLNCAPEELSVEDGVFLQDGNADRPRLLEFRRRPRISPPTSTGPAQPKPPAAYKVVGQPVPRRDLIAKVTGAAFIHDIVRPDMLHARVLRQPSRGARLAVVGRGGDPASRRRRDPHRARRRFRGVRRRRRNRRAARRGGRSGACEMDRRARADAGAAGGRMVPRPAIRRPLSSAIRLRRQQTGTVVSETYSRPFVAHAALAPSCGLAEYRDGHLSVWSHTQGVYPLRNSLADILGLKREQVTVRHAHGAGCYGHNGADDAALDAAIIAMQIPDHCIRVQWRREEEFGFEPVSTAHMTTLRAAAGRRRPAGGLDRRGLGRVARAAAGVRRHHAGARGAAEPAARRQGERSGRGERRRRHAQRVSRCTISRPSG